MQRAGRLTISAAPSSSIIGYAGSTLLFENRRRAQLLLDTERATIKSAPHSSSYGHRAGARALNGSQAIVRESDTW